MTRRLRIAHVIVQPVLVWDDGENLSPAPPANAVQVAMGDLDGLADRLRGEVAVLEAQEPPVT